MTSKSTLSSREVVPFLGFFLIAHKKSNGSSPIKKDRPCDPTRLTVRYMNRRSIRCSVIRPNKTLTLRCLIRDSSSSPIKSSILGDLVEMACSSYQSISITQFFSMASRRCSNTFYIFQLFCRPILHQEGKLRNSSRLW